MNILSLSDTNPKFLQSWLRLQRTVQSAIAASTVKEANTVFVDGLYGTPAGERNNPAKPFKTIQQGVDAAQFGDIIRVSPGTYAESVVIPPSLGVGIIGTGDDTIIAPPAGNAITFNSNADTGLMLVGLHCYGDINVSPQTFDFGLTRRLVVSDLLLDNGASLRVKACFQGIVENVLARQGFNGIFFDECEDMRVIGCRLVRLHVGWSDSAIIVPPVTQYRSTYVYGCEIAFADVTDLGRMEAYGSWFQGATFGNTYSMNANAVQSGPGASTIGSVRAVGCSFVDVGITPNISDAQGPLFVPQVASFEGCEIEGLICDNVGPGPTRPVVRASNCAFRSSGGRDGSVQGGTGMVIDLRGSLIAPLQISQGGAPFSGFYLSEYDLGQVLGQLAVVNSLVVNLPIYFESPNLLRMLATSPTVDATFALTAAVPNQITVAARVGGAIAPAAADIVLIQSS